MSEPALTLWLRRAVAEYMEAEASHYFPRETGGVLMGYWSSGEVVVTAAIGPGPKATHSEYGFGPDHEWQQERIANHYTASGRMETYLGDWHCHPGAEHPGLSRKDRCTLHRIAMYSSARLPTPIMVVLIGGGSKWEITGWAGKSSRKLLVPRLTLIPLRPRLADATA